MWFKFPDNVTSASVQQQEFSTEAEDEGGGRFFRAPDHFAGLILDLPGFTADAPPGDLPDLPKADPVKDTNLERLSGQVGALKSENEELRALLSETKAERDDLKVKLHEAETNLKNAEADLAEATKPAKAK